MEYKVAPGRPRSCFPGCKEISEGFGYLMTLVVKSLNVASEANQNHDKLLDARKLRLLPCNFAAVEQASIQ